MSTRDSVLSAIEAAGGRQISGAVLAQALGLTRASVWKHIRTLQSEGLPINSKSRHGYRWDLSKGPSFCRFSPAAPLKRWLVPHYAVEVSSTQTLAKAGAEKGLPEGHLWIAERQTKGRGRLDREWVSSFGGIWMSLLLRPSIGPSRVPALPLVAALTLAEILKRSTTADVTLKWPNDVGVGKSREWKKVAGFLTEMSGEMDRTGWVVLGLGVNVHNEIPKSLPKATALGSFLNPAVSRLTMLNDFLVGFRQAYRQFEREGFEPFRKRYWEYYRAHAEAVTIATARGTLKGIARGVDGEGRLVVESRRQTVHLFEGEIVS